MYHHDIRHTYTLANKYKLVGRILRSQSGTLLDVGARDRILSKQLDLHKITYYSADIGTGHDYVLNLEQKIELPDRHFSMVVALDVLEHLEYIHQAFHELVRITQNIFIIALPNLSTLYRRIAFLLYGNLRSGKYWLLPEHQGDRHRWLTIYPEMNRFVAVNAEKAGFRVRHVFEEVEGVQQSFGLTALAAYTDLFKNGLFTARCTYVLTRI